MTTRPTSVLALHSAALDRTEWDAFRAALPVDLREGFTAIDLPGHGAAAVDGSPADLESMTRSAEAALIAADTEVHVIGHSIGGVVAGALAAVRPDLVASLTIVCAPPAGVGAFIERAERAETLGIDAVIEDTVTRWFTAEAIVADTAPVRFARDRIGRMTSDAWSTMWRSFAEFPGFVPVARSVRVLCVAGEVDASTPPEAVARVAAALGDAELVVIPGAPHQLPLTHPGLLASLWVDRLVRSEAA